MRCRLAPLLFAEEGPPEAGAGPVGPPERSAAAKRKDCTRETPEGLPVHSFPDLLESLAGLTAQELRVREVPEVAVALLSEPDPLQQRAFELLGIEPHRPPPEILARDPPPTPNSPKAEPS